MPLFRWCSVTNLRRYSAVKPKLFIYPNSPVVCKVGSQYWVLYQSSLYHRGAEMGWYRSESVLWFPRHRSRSKRSSWTNACSYRQLRRKKSQLVFSLFSILPYPLKGETSINYLKHKLFEIACYGIK